MMFNPAITNDFRLKKIKLCEGINDMKQCRVNDVKRCSKCTKTKENKAFYANAARKDGLADWCKACINDYRKSRKINKTMDKKISIQKEATERQKIENGETVVLDPKFMVITKDWGEETFKALGHKLIQINVTGVIFSKRSSHSYSIDLKNRTVYPIVVTIKDHGETKLLKISGNKYNLIRDGLLAWLPASPKGAGNLKFKFNVKSIITKNIATGYHILWKLTQSNNGELYASAFQTPNAKDKWVKMKDMTRKKILDIADDLAYDICQYFPGRTQAAQWICKKVIKLDTKIEKLNTSPVKMREE